MCQAYVDSFLSALLAKIYSSLYVVIGFRVSDTALTCSTARRACPICSGDFRQRFVLLAANLAVIRAILRLMLCCTRTLSGGGEGEVPDVGMQKFPSCLVI